MEEIVGHHYDIVTIVSDIDVDFNLDAWLIHNSYRTVAAHIVDLMFASAEVRKQQQSLCLVKDALRARLIVLCTSLVH